MTWLLLTTAGAVGAAARHLAGSLIQRRSGARFPVGTLTVNLAGALAIGLATGLDGDTAVLVAGFLGGFTTFSTWMVETIEIAEEPGRGREAALNLLGMLLPGLALAAVGMALVA